MVELFKVSVMSFDQWDIYVFQNMKCVIFDDWAMRWQCILIYIYIYSYLYDNYDYDTDFHVMVMLCSTTGPYGRPVIEVAYGKMILSLHQGCMGDDNSRRVVGVSAWCIAHVRHTQVNTSVGSMYYFPNFQHIKPMYMYIVLKIYK